MDRRSRACMLLHTRYAEVVEVGQIVGTRNTAQHQNMQRKNATGAQWTGGLVSSSHRQKEAPCQWGKKE